MPSSRRSPHPKRAAPARPRQPGPATDARPSRPTADERPSRPTADERPSRPTADERPSRPAADERPLDPAELDALQDALDALPAPLEPLDVAAIDGFLCAVVVQPRPVPHARWLPLVLDAEGRRPPPGVDVSAIAAAVERRERQLRQAIGGRQWFDPWLFADDTVVVGAAADDAAEAARELVAPWISGFAIGFEAFPALHDRGGADMVEALALLYRHFDADDLEDADELLAAIDAIGPAGDAEDAVEGLVRGTLLLADVAADLAGG